MTHGSATVPDPLHPLHRHDVGACELPLPRELEPVAFRVGQPHPGTYYGYAEERSQHVAPMSVSAFSTSELARVRVLRGVDSDRRA